MFYPIKKVNLLNSLAMLLKKQGFECC